MRAFLPTQAPHDRRNRGLTRDMISNTPPSISTSTMALRKRPLWQSVTRSTSRCATPHPPPYAPPDSLSRPHTLAEPNSTQNTTKIHIIKHVTSPSRDFPATRRVRPNSGSDGVPCWGPHRLKNGQLELGPARSGLDSTFQAFIELASIRCVGAREATSRFGWQFKVHCSTSVGI